MMSYFIALGGNVASTFGDPARTLEAALDQLVAKGCALQGVSRFYHTPCFPVGAGPDYVNAAAEVGFDGAPEAFLRVLHEVEAEFGRERVQRWGRRCLDLDLIAAGDMVLPDRAGYDAWRDLPPEDQAQVAPDCLILPHPRMQERAFVLVPLSDVAEEWVHPVIGKSVAQMLSELPKNDVSQVKPA